VHYQIFEVASHQVRHYVTYLANVGGLELKVVDSSRFELVLCILGTHQLQLSRVTFAAKDLDKDIGVSASAALFASLHRDVIRRRCRPYVNTSVSFSPILDG